MIFNPESIYNPIYEKKKEERSEKSKDSDELLSWEKGDEKIVLHSVKGLLRFKKSSSSQLEEDLSGVESGAETIPKEEQKKVFINACKDVISSFGRLVHKKALDEAFPGLDLDNIENYDFSQARIKTVVFDSQTYNDFTEAYGKNAGTFGFMRHKSGRISKSFKPFGLKNPVYSENLDFNERNTIIVLKAAPYLKGAGSISEQLSFTLKHELLHVLKVGNGLPADSYEGVIETYTHLLYDKESEAFGRSYVTESRLALGIMTFCVHAGMDSSLVDKALLGSDVRSLAKMEDLVAKEFGNALSNCFFHAGFENQKERRAALITVNKKLDSFEKKS